MSASVVSSASRAIASWRSLPAEMPGQSRKVSSPESTSLTSKVS